MEPGLLAMTWKTMRMFTMNLHALDELNETYSAGARRELEKQNRIDLNFHSCPSRSDVLQSPASSLCS